MNGLFVCFCSYMFDVAGEIDFLSEKSECNTFFDIPLAL